MRWAELSQALFGCSEILAFLAVTKITMQNLS